MSRHAIDMLGNTWRLAYGTSRWDKKQPLVEAINLSTEERMPTDDFGRVRRIGQMADNVAVLE